MEHTHSQRSLRGLAQIDYGALSAGWRAYPWLLAAMGLSLLLWFTFRFFRKKISNPIAALMDGAAYIQEGDWGRQIDCKPGYRDFEYAQRAIRLGVCRFLLKPSKMDELEEAVAYMTAQLDRLPLLPRSRRRMTRRTTPTALSSGRPEPTSPNTATGGCPSRMWRTTASSASGT